ncbi:MAG: hypothetical protein ACP5NV_01715 [Candidatus Woesearchaeota archaeon]
MSDISYSTLRENLKNWPKENGTKHVGRSLLINKGFPGTFNLSYSEENMLNEYGGYVNFDHDYFFTKIQNCIRPQDLNPREEDTWKYLGVFEMGDIIGELNYSKMPKTESRYKNIRALIDFFESNGIPKKKIFPSYQIGGSVKEITKGKYLFDCRIPSDPSRDIFIEFGIPEKNLIPDNTRDTLLALSLNQTTPWGYRNEINVDVGTERLLDVATLEFFIWNPVMEKKTITGLVNSDSGAAINVIGLERFNMAINGFERVQDVDYIKPFYDRFGRENYLAGENLRALHALFSDISYYGLPLSGHIREKIRGILRRIPKLPSTTLKDALSANAELQPWHPELKEGIDATIERIERYRAALK